MLVGLYFSGKLFVIFQLIKNVDEIRDYDFVIVEIKQNQLNETLVEIYISNNGLVAFFPTDRLENQHKLHIIIQIIILNNIILMKNLRFIFNTLYKHYIRLSKIILITLTEN